MIFFDTQGSRVEINSTSFAVGSRHKFAKILHVTYSAGLETH